MSIPRPDFADSFRKVKIAIIGKLTSVISCGHHPSVLSQDEDPCPRNHMDSLPTPLSKSKRRGPCPESDIPRHPPVLRQEGWSLFKAK